MALPTSQPFHSFTTLSSHIERCVTVKLWKSGTLKVLVWTSGFFGPLDIFDSILDTHISSVFKHITQWYNIFLMKQASLKGVGNWALSTTKSKGIPGNRTRWVSFNKLKNTSTLDPSSAWKPTHIPKARFFQLCSHTRLTVPAEDWPYMLADRWFPGDEDLVSKPDDEYWKKIFKVLLQSESSCFIVQLDIWYLFGINPQVLGP